jgi:hypothetical protein
VRDITERHRPLCREGLHPRLAAKVSDLISEVEELDLLRPAIAYQFWPVAEIGGKRLRLASGVQFADAPALAHRLGGASEVVALVCTIGGELDSRAGLWFSERRASDAVVLSEIGIAALGVLRDDALALIGQEAGGRGLDASGPLSPGDAGFDLSGQELLLDLAGARRIGVELGSTLMMSPAKTLSMLVGLGRNMPKWSHADACEVCAARDNCRYRIPAREAVPV